MIKMNPTSRLAQALSAGKRALLAECLPPRGADAAAVKQLAALFPQSVDAVVVAENREHVRSSPLACAALLAAEKVEPILSMVTRDRNRIALESDVLGASALGIKGFLCMSGMHQSLGATPQAAGAYDIDSIQLTQAIARMASEAVGFSGQKMESSPDVFAMAVGHPHLLPIELNILGLKKKAAAGARALFTDAVFDIKAFERWMDAVRLAGINKQTTIVASILPLTSVRMAEDLRSSGAHGPIGKEIVDRLRSAADGVKEGLTIAAEIARTIKSVPGVGGIHILSGGAEGVVPELIAAAGLA
jgi:methylenetetrahydrofolate reductase (NADPH)